MLKKIAIGVGIMVFAVPIFAAADTNIESQFIALYQQLIQLLQKELEILRGMPVQGPHASMTIQPTSGKAPLTVTFTVSNPMGDENIDYGDGRSVGSNGCAKNSTGWCDLSNPVSHTYQFPGSYSVKLYDQGKKLRLLSSTTVQVLPATNSQTQTY